MILNNDRVLIQLRHLQPSLHVLYQITRPHRYQQQSTEAVHTSRLSPFPSKELQQKVVTARGSVDLWGKPGEKRDYIGIWDLAETWAETSMGQSSTVRSDQLGSTRRRHRLTASWTKVTSCSQRFNINILILLHAILCDFIFMTYWNGPFICKICSLCSSHFLLNTD